MTTNDHLKLRQWWAIVRDRLTRQWYLVWAWFGMAPVALLAVFVNGEDLLHVDLLIMIAGIPLMLFLPTRDLDFDTLLPFLPIERRTFGRIRWLTNVVAIPLVIALGPIVVSGFDIVVSGDKVMLTGLSMVFVILFAFLGTFTWLLHPRLKRHIWFAAPALWVMWVFTPLNLSQWNDVQWSLAAVCVVLAMSSYLAAPAILGMPRRDLLSVPTSNSTLERLYRSIDRRNPTRFLGRLAQRYWRDFLYVGPLALVVVVYWYAEIIPLVASLGCVTCLVPLRHAFPTDVSVIRTLPIDSRRFALHVARNYVAVSGTLIALIAGWDMVRDCPAMTDHTMLATAIAGYGFLFRVVLWRIQRDKTLIDATLWFLFLLGLVGIAEHTLGFWAGWLAQVAGRPSPISPGELLLGIGLTSPIALLVGVTIFLRALTRDMSIYRFHASTMNRDSLGLG